MKLSSQRIPEYKITRDTYTICQSCSYFSLSFEKHKFCILCGGKMTAECAECFEPILYPTARFCPSCGTPYRPLPDAGAPERMRAAGVDHP